MCRTLNSHVPLILPPAPLTHSATGASEVGNMAYLSRMGLWGVATAFPDFDAFLESMKRRGVSFMEMLAMEMKAEGKYVARGLSFRWERSLNTRRPGAGASGIHIFLGSIRPLTQKNENPTPWIPNPGSEVQHPEGWAGTWVSDFPRSVSLQRSRAMGGLGETHFVSRRRWAYHCTPCEACTGPFQSFPPTITPQQATVLGGSDRAPALTVCSSSNTCERLNAAVCG